MNEFILALSFSGSVMMMSLIGVAISYRNNEFSKKYGINRRENYVVKAITMAISLIFITLSSTLYYLNGELSHNASFWLTILPTIPLAIVTIHIYDSSIEPIGKVKFYFSSFTGYLLFYNENLLEEKKLFKSLFGFEYREYEKISKHHKDLQKIAEIGRRFNDLSENQKLLNELKLMSFRSPLNHSTLKLKKELEEDVEKEMKSLKEDGKILHELLYRHMPHRITSPSELDALQKLQSWKEGKERP
ncbi:hypothetical protein JMA_38610 (plasmid) [Jeotgalibacillus malaysiensis]|uniref:Uncharacterized protein n=1 Tax=Jeotgalibacillus malaysiensis TaxID=1508404 RepID=A0A0B5AYV8_9BACL|nr:hypothetical protein [Jeotgalibacillus malaysiensis]AJD93179.1 hypothetical protein JMA_38610 [Jeotgalibacillus malaysiensis]